MTAGPQPYLGTDFLVDYMQKNAQEKFLIFESFSLSCFGFEHLHIPAPAEYDKILTQCYGDYHQFVQGGSAHEDIIMEPDIPYKTYFSKSLL